MPDSFFEVRRYGAAGVAEASQTLTVENPQFGIAKLPVGLKVPIYHAKANADHDSIGIQRAIDAAHAVGGGTVYVPAGDYLISPIQLRSRVNLHLGPGARLWGSPHLPDYLSTTPVLTSSVDQGFAREEAGLSGQNKRRLISADNAEDCAITGMGSISAQSLSWIVPWLNSRPSAWLKERPTDTLIFHRCRRVRVEGIRILDTPAWTLVFDNCDHVTVHGIEIYAADVLNSDGIDLVNSSNVTISDCRIHCTDDAICLKNTQPDATMSNVVVNNCIIRTLCNALKIGTDTTGNFQNVAFSNIVIRNPEDDVQGAEGGINICSLDGGFVRNVSINNVVMQNVQCPFYLVSHCRTKNQKPYRTPRPGRMTGIALSNIQADGVRAPAFVVGHDEEPITDLTFSNVRIRKTSGAYPQQPPAFKNRYQYPTPYMFGHESKDDLPAHGLYVRNTAGLCLRDIRIDTTEPDVRPSIQIDRSTKVDTDQTSQSGLSIR